jgi:3-hydroxybutyryl-CoA dehydrogenase
MKILIIGDDEQTAECRQKFGDTHEYFSQSQGIASAFFDHCDVLFDFFADTDYAVVKLHDHPPRIPLFLNATKKSLLEITLGLDLQSQPVFGFPGLPTFLNREIFEVSVLDFGRKNEFQEIFRELNTDYELVDDRIGFVTPRVICMIINEAYFTVQEGTANREDIDLAMKLGTNYPYGPFEWCKKIGVHHVYELLEAVYNDTHDDRYKICPLLKKEYLSSIPK